MLRPFSITLLAAIVLAIPLNSACVTALEIACPAPEVFNNLALGRKTVTAYAGNETEAVARAEKANPGWKAVAAKKVNNDPKSRAWQVAMTKD